MDSRDILVRASKTFVQAFLAFVAAGVAGVTNFQTARALLISALAAAISVTWNTVVPAVRR